MQEMMDEACVNAPQAAHARLQMAATTSHMLHSESVAKTHYRMNTDSRAQTAGKAVKAFLSKTRKRPLPNLA